jgi:hypothetical protein
MIEPGHEFDHGAARRAKRGDSRYNKPTKKADDRRLAARQTRQPVNPCDHAGMNVVPQHSVVGHSFGVTVECIDGAMGEYECVLDAKIHASRRNRRMNVGSIPRQRHATDHLSSGDAVTDMKLRLPVNCAGAGTARQARKQFGYIPEYPPDAGFDAK